MPASRLSPSVALITGAGQRLGAALAGDLAARGFDLVLHAFRSTREARALAKRFEAQGRRVRVLRADLRKPAEVRKLAREAWRAFGALDLLVNNAAAFESTSLEGLNETALDAQLALNLKAPYLLSAELGRRMKRRGRGQIVNLACLSAFRAWKDYVPYSISKAGLVALTQGLALLLAPEVRVNAVAPGVVLPPERYDASTLRALKRRIPLKRLGRPADVVRAVAYLVEADFVTGEVLRVDGGRALR
ncbi:MAG: SDR family oxidoreductase [Planctomycetota bacterium]|nr:SDR family oxidoreductase [Planctomycetota bacterium]